MEEQEKGEYWKERRKGKYEEWPKKGGKRAEVEISNQKKKPIHPALLHVLAGSVFNYRPNEPLGPKTTIGREKAIPLCPNQLEKCFMFKQV